MDDLISDINVFSVFMKNHTNIHDVIVKECRENTNKRFTHVYSTRHSCRIHVVLAIAIVRFRVGGGRVEEQGFTVQLGLLWNL